MLRDSVSKSTIRFTASRARFEEDDLDRIRGANETLARNKGQEGIALIERDPARTILC